MTTKRTPPTRTSDEANEQQLKMAAEQGATYVKALKHMAQDVADDGDEVRAGDYSVAYAIEDAEGMYHRQDGKLVWQEPGERNVHVEISVRDGADNRFIPNLDVEVTLIDPDDHVVGTHQQPYLWHPWLYHYGRNWQVPRSGAYRLRVRIAAPDFPRHDKENGKRFADPVEVEFQQVMIDLS